MLTVVRHGRTSYNEDGRERLRGWLDIPLDHRGEEESDEVAGKLKNLGVQAQSYSTSPLRRAVQTAGKIEDELGVEFQPSENLKDWNIGDYAGQEVSHTLSTLHSFIDKPYKPTPNGESYGSFVDRVQPFVKQLVESPDNHLVVTHNRVTTLIKALASSKGRTVNMADIKKKGPIEPAGIMVVKPDWSIQVLDHGSDSGV